MTVVTLDRSRSLDSGLPAPRLAPPKILMIFPLFNPHSFWSFKETCKIVGAKYPAPPLGLITLAAMLPKDWDVRLVNCNCEPLRDEDIAWADLVMTGGMLPQQIDCLKIMARCRRLGTPVCIGGPDPTSSPHIYAEADFLVLGEAEGIIDTFVAAWRRGDRTGRFDAEKFQADVTKSPIPRYDLLDFKHYLYVGLQFSRGCPFNCEFCDIIELYGRVPRTKTTPQVLAELDRLMELGYRGHVDFVDDNLIGNKKALRKFLPELKAWQAARKYPFKFSTEASLNLADDEDLLHLLAECNFFACFIGIESGDGDTLVSMQKKQNTRRSIADSVHRIYAHGIYVIAGFIVGFDTEKNRVSEDMVKLIQDTSIPVCTVGLLTALPNTQLTRRLEKEGRLFEGYDRPPPSAADACTAGLNFTTLRPRREIIERLPRGGRRDLHAGGVFRAPHDSRQVAAQGADRPRSRRPGPDAPRHRDAEEARVAALPAPTEYGNPVLEAVCLDLAEQSRRARARAHERHGLHARGPVLAPCRGRVRLADRLDGPRPAARASDARGRAGEGGSGRRSLGAATAACPDSEYPAGRASP